MGIMDFIELAKKRYSSRKYKAKVVEEEKLKLILEAGRISPSAANYQPWIFIVVKDENIDNIRRCYPRDWFKTSSVYIILCSDHMHSWKRADGKDHADIDVAIAADHMTLAATDIGLSTCWVCNFDMLLLSKVLNLPSNIEPVVILSLGYPEDTVDMSRHESKRKKTEEIIYYEKYK